MTQNVHFSSKTPEWPTPQKFFDALHQEFKFDLDPCATAENAKVKIFFTAAEDGLSKSWKGCRVFCNPPYGRQIGAWVEKCAGGGGQYSRLRYCLREPTPAGSMITFIPKLKSGSSREG